MQIGFALAITQPETLTSGAATTGDLLLEDGVSYLLLEDGATRLALE